MNYTVTAVGDDWVDIWDGSKIIDPDTPRHKSTERVYVGPDHPFILDDVVTLAVRLVARITPPDTEPTNFSTITTPELIERTQDLAESWRATAQQWLDLGREDRQVLDQHG